MDIQRSKRRLIIPGIAALLIAGAALYVSPGSDSENVLISSTIRQRLEHETTHPLLSRQRTLQQRSIAQHDFATQIEVHFPLPSTLAPTLSSTRHLQLSGTIALDGNAAYYPGGGPGNGTIELTTDRSLFSGALPIGQYTLASAVDLVRSGTKLWIALDSITTTQSGQESLDLLMREGVLTEYLHKRIVLTGSQLPTLFTARIFTTLGEQPSQHVIPTRSGEVILLIQGEQMILSGTITPSQQAEVLLSFVTSQLLLDLQQLDKKADYRFQLTSPQSATHRANGTAHLGKQFGNLSSTFDRTGSSAGGMVRTGTHTSTFSPTSFLSVNFPRGALPRPELRAALEAKFVERIADN